ncbi:hypothetical protein ADL03_41285 [Nocardia sp. NRRL S-836]|nr:hypothetical protein ADL03_41285 [Nocardia sp. NRRL S-836]
MTAVAAAPLVNGKARPFLEEVAFRCLDRPFTAALARAAGAHRLDAPGQSDDLLRLLADSGVIAEHGGELGFVPGGLTDYLAACHVVRRHPRGPNLLHPHRRFLRPRSTWPWPDSETALFQVALWWTTAETAMRKRLRVLLSPRHRDPNVHFVATLLHRGLVTADDLREQTVEILLGHLGDDGRTAGAWRATLAALELLEPSRTADALERLVQAPGRRASSLRRFDAVEALAERDPARGERGLRLLAETLTGDRHERLEVAGMIRQRDTELGDRAARLLANTGDMGDLRVDAAKLTGDLALWAELVGDGRGISDSARLGLLAELADADQALASAAAERFAETASAGTTPVGVATAVRMWDPEVALRIADGVAWPVRREVDGPVRRMAVHLIGELVPARRFTDLERLSREVPDEKTQFDAASDIVEQGGPVTALRDFAANPKKSRERRLLAARGVGKVDPRSGGRLLVDIAESYKPTDPDQLKLLRDAHALAPAAAAKALEAIVRVERRPASFRVRAVELGIFDRNKTVELYEHIATTARDKDDARTAARKVLGMRQDIGEQLMARLAKKFTADPAFQLSLAREAGAHGKTVLHQLGLHTPSLELRVEVAAALLDVDRRLAADVIDKVVRTRRGGEIRIRAACLLPDRQALDALRHIVNDQDDEDVLLAAAVRAWEIDKGRGKRLLRDLAGSRRVSQHTRDRIGQVLGG